MLSRLASQMGYGALGSSGGFRTRLGLWQAMCLYSCPARDVSITPATSSDDGTEQRANPTEPAHAC